MKTVVIFYEHVSREYEACLRLKLELEKNDYCKVYIYSLHFQILDAIILDHRQTINAIIIPYAYKESSLLPIAYLIRKTPIPYIINLHHEQIAPPFLKDSQLPMDSCTRDRIIHFVWTNSFRKKLEILDISEDHIHVTGNMRTDTFQIKRNENRQIFSSEFHLNPNKKWILLSESGTHQFIPNANHRALDINIWVKRGYKKEDFLLWNSEIAKVLNRFSKQMAKLGDSFFDNYELIYRAHPGETIKNKINNKVKVIDKYSINDWLNVVDANVSRYSTTLFESECNSIPSLRYDPTNFPLRLLVPGLDEYRKLEDLNNIGSNIIELAKEDLKRNKIYEKYIGLVDGNSTKRSAAIIINILENKNKSYDRSALKLKYKKYIFRKISGNVFARLIIKYNFLRLKKYSKSLTILLNDIPPNWIQSKL